MLKKEAVTGIVFAIDVAAGEFPARLRRDAESVQRFIAALRARLDSATPEEVGQIGQATLALYATFIRGLLSVDPRRWSIATLLRGVDPLREFRAECDRFAERFNLAWKR